MARGENGRILTSNGSRGRSPGQGNRKPWLVRWHDGSTYRSKSFSRRRIWYPALATSGIEPLRIYDLRHTAASLAVQAGANPLIVARMLGHADPSITMKAYADLFPDDLRAVAERLDQAMRKPPAEAGGFPDPSPR